MAIAKVILNGETLMDVTSDTATANNMLSGIKATKNDGTKATGNIASKSSTDLSVSGATVTAPAGYYANAASKAVATTTHPNPTASITSSTGVVTASHTQGTGYVTGGTTTGTLSLTTQAGKTVTPTESAQTAVASYRWTTGPVSVAAISSTYVGTGVTTRSATDLTASGSNVTAPAGYYSSGVSKSVDAGTAFTPAVTITKAPTITLTASTGVVTATYNGSSSITPTVTSGYVGAGTAGTVSTTGTSTYQLTMRSAADMTVAAQSVTAPAGYYSQAFTKAVTVTTHPNPTAAITSSTGVVTATHAQTAGYVAAGTTTGTTQLASKAAAIYNTSTADQTIGSYQWLTGTQTIKSVITTNLTAENIAKGVVVKVGDSNNASRITQITGTLVAGTPYTARIFSETGGNNSNCYVQYNGVKYYTNGQTFTFYAGDTITLYTKSTGGSKIKFGNGTYRESSSSTACSYLYEAIGCDISIFLVYEGTWSELGVAFINDSGDGPKQELDLNYMPGAIIPSQSQQIIEPGISYYGLGEVIVAPMPSGSATPAASVSATGATVTTGTNTLTLSKSVSNTPQVTAGYVSAGTAGNTSVSLTANITTKAATTITPTTTNQTISSGTYLTGTQTITGDANLIAANIAEGVSIFGVTGTHSGGASYIVTITFSGSTSSIGSSSYVKYKNIIYKSGDTIFVSRGDTIQIYVGTGDHNYLYINNVQTTGGWGTINGYEYTVTSDTNIDFQLSIDTSYAYITIPTIDITENGNYDVADYARANVTVGGFTVDQIALRSISGSISGNVSKIGSYAFAGCSELTAVSFPLCTYIDMHAFAYCGSLSEIDFPACTSMGNSAFAYCGGLQTVSFPSCIYIGYWAFADCGTLESISFPKCSYIYDTAFKNCVALQTVNLPLVLHIYNSVFAYCISLRSINLPKCSQIGSYAFQGCYSLQVASFPSCTQILASAFHRCYNLLSLYLLGSSVASLTSTYVFSSTPISTYTTSTGGTYGSIFVPASLYESYITATNWSRFSSRFVSV